MKVGVLLIIIGIVLITDDGMRIVLIGWPGFSGFLFAAPFFYIGIKKLRKVSQKL